METQTFDDVFDALSDTPAEAANRSARADLLAVLAAQVKSWGLPQEAAAARLGITRPRLNDLLRGKLGKVSPGRPGQPRHGGGAEVGDPGGGGGVGGCVRDLAPEARGAGRED